MIRGIFKIFKKREKSYISEPDKFIHEFDQKNTSRSKSQREEILKHRNIFSRKPDHRIKW
jgi:hypothetical protein